MNNQQTPTSEAMWLIAIAAIMVSVVCFTGAINEVPILTPVMQWVAEQVYAYFPALARLRAPQIPVVVAAAVTGCLFCLVALPFAPMLARLFSVGQMANLDRLQRRLKRKRELIEQRQRDRDDFEVN